jgi:sialate O-acetylesterase
MRSISGVEGRTMRFGTFAVFFGLAAGMTAHAELKLPGVLSDHAVLQRNAPIHIWGWAKPGAKVTIHFHDQSTEAVADDAGEWSGWLTPEQAGGPFVLKVDGDGSAKRTDILVGDVWLASGQSNMEFPLKGFPGAPMNDSDKEIAAAAHPRIRLFQVPIQSAQTPQTDIQADWTECTPATAAKFSAVAYFFGREISEREDVPVGLIDSTKGGVPADSWVSMDTLGGNAALRPAFYARALFADGESRRQELATLEKSKEEEAKAAGKPAPKPSWHPDQTSWLPAGLYNAMIAPLTSYSIKGFLWYQGETNSRSERYRDYVTLFPALIDDWRARFAQGDLPFLFAQISSFYSPKEHWGVIRDAQRRTLKLRNTGMAVTIDVGNPKNVHPADKQTVGARLALAARGLVYGEKVEYVSPMLRQVTNCPGELHLWFDHAEGLTSRGPLDAFEIAGENGNFVPASAKAEGETVIVSSPKVAFPVYVRYAWASDAKGSLYNAAGLPAGTFTTEDEPLD